MQFKWVLTTYAFYKEVDRKYTGCNLKIMELLDYMLIGVCVVIRSDAVFYLFLHKNVMVTHLKC